MVRSIGVNVLWFGEGYLTETLIFALNPLFGVYVVMSSVSLKLIYYENKR
jgi:hypothetical protein